MRGHCETLGVVVGSGLAGLHVWFTTRPDRGEIPESAAAAALGISTVLLCRFPTFRAIARALTAVQAIVSFMLVHILMKLYGIDPVEHLSFNVAIPMAVALFIVSDWRAPGPDPIPGHEYLDRGARSIGVETKLVILAVLLLLGTAATFGSLFISLLAIPVTIAFWVIHVLIEIVRTRRPATTTTARRVRVPHGQLKPAQKRSYWTVSEAEFHRNEPDE